MEGVGLSVELILQRRMRLAAFAALGGILALLLAMQMIFAGVVKEDDWVEHAHRVRFTSTSLLVAVFRAVAKDSDRAALPPLYLSLPSTTVASLASAPPPDTPPASPPVSGTPPAADPAADMVSGAAPRWQPAMRGLAVLADLIRDDPRQIRRVAELRVLVEERAGRHGPDDDSTRAAFLETVRDRVAAIHEEETRLLERRTRRVGHLRWLFVGGSLGISLIVGALTWWQWQSALAEAAREEAARLRLQGMLAEKTALLREVNHRVGNGLAMMTTLLQLQARDTADPAAIQALGQARRRTRALGVIHRHLLRANAVEVVDYRALFPPLMTELAADHGRAVRVEVGGPAVPVPVDAALALALILDEALGALSGGTPSEGARPGAAPSGEGLDDDDGGRLAIHLMLADDAVLCRVDDPRGRLLPSALAEGDGIGSTSRVIIETLARQIAATLSYPVPGHRWEIRFGMPPN